MTLARRAPARPVVSVGIFEVARGRAAPGDYAAEFGADTLPFDLVVFTPGTEREDPCDALEGHDWKVKKMSADHPPVTEEGGAPAPAGGGGAAAKP